MERTFVYNNKIYRFICFFGFGNRVFGCGEDRIMVDIDGKVINEYHPRKEKELEVA